MLDYSYLSYYLKLWRTRAGMSIRDAFLYTAAESPKQVLEWEQGLSAPSLTQLKRFRELYHIPHPEFTQVLIYFEKQQLYSALDSIEEKLFDYSDQPKFSVSLLTTI